MFLQQQEIHNINNFHTSNHVAFKIYNLLQVTKLSHFYFQDPLILFFSSQVRSISTFALL